ncbi:uncharacterized protein KY384_008926 [Bacidia gigantensis]|uniref:uncharacterized protein n=1 Tax=Bacidia gigantensis TaxID=2732470 RepID=UPI001D042339|nr:uncharacterized protein KY384_008926 [Bacidia gigantensis]KAG8525282.1 hypothetical protein KY384_008926 [Bacidia gigantensis]
MICSAKLKCILQSIAIFSYLAAGHPRFPAAVEDDVSAFDWDDDAFIDEEPIARRSNIDIRIGGELVDFPEAAQLVQRQDLGDGPANTNPATAGGTLTDILTAVNAFFYSWWLAVGSSGSLASDNIGKIVQILDPPAKTNFLINGLLVAFQSIFAIVPGVAGVWASHSALNYRFQLGAQVISNALATAPNVGRFLFPTDSSASQVVQLAELSNNFGTILQQVQSNLNQTLVQVMSNVTEFLAFAEQGNFSSKPQSLPDQTGYLYYAFNTYLISQALNGNNIYGVIGKGTDPLQLKTNGSTLAHNFDVNCDQYDAQNVCDAWWYSGNYRSAFTLDNFSKMNVNYGAELTTLFTNLTSGELLFEGAYACASQGLFGGPVNVTVTKKGVNTACISQLRILTWDMTCHDENGARDATSCEFLEAPEQNTFWYSQSLWRGASTRRYSVPYGYLGPGVTQKDLYLSRT